MRIVALVGIIVTVLVKTHKMFEKRSGIKKICIFALLNAVLWRRLLKCQAPKEEPAVILSRPILRRPPRKDQGDLYEAEEGMRVKEYGRSCCVLIDFDRKIVFDKRL